MGPGQSEALQRALADLQRLQGAGQQEADPDLVPQELPDGIPPILGAGAGLGLPPAPREMAPQPNAADLDAFHSPGLGVSPSCAISQAAVS